MPGSRVRVPPQLLTETQKGPSNSRRALSATNRELEAGENHEFVATVLRAAVFFAGRRASRSLFAVCGNANPRSVNATIGEVAVRNRSAVAYTAVDLTGRYFNSRRLRDLLAGLL